LKALNSFCGSLEILDAATFSEASGDSIGAGFLGDFFALKTSLLKNAKRKNFLKRIFYMNFARFQSLDVESGR